MNEATKKVIGNANIKYILANPVMLPIIRSIGAWQIDIYITCVPIPEIRLPAVVKTVGTALCNLLCHIFGDNKLTVFFPCRRNEKLKGVETFAHITATTVA